MANYTEEQKAAVLARVPEIGVKAAAAEAGIPWQAVAKWNKATAKASADEKISEAQEVIEKAEEENKTAVIDAVQEKAEEVKATVEEKAEALKDSAAAIEIELKKKASKASRKVQETKEAVKETADRARKPAQKAKTIKMDLVFESAMGGQITPEEIAAKVPKGTDAAYVKMEENKIYWVKGEETGSVDIW